MYSAASFLIRRRCVIQFFESVRCFSTQTLTLTGGYDSSNKEERIPKQMVFSQDQEPQQQLRRLFSHSGSKDHNFLEFQPEINPLRIASAGKTLCVGSSEGILFSVPNKDPTVISAIDPTHLPLLSTASLFLMEGKTVLSPEFIENGKGRNFVASFTLPIPNSFLIRCRRSRHCFYPWRSFSTQTQGQNLVTDDADSRKERARRRRVPMLMVFSRYQSPQSCSGLLSLSRSMENGKDRNFLKFEQEISLPETAAADKSICIGSSGGILFTIPKEMPTEMSTVDPLTGAHLPLPLLPDDSCSFDLNHGKSILSPYRDMVILSHLTEIHIAHLGDEGDRYWTPLLNDFGYIHDTIFHKGLLYALSDEGLVGIYDLNNPSWPTLTGSQPLPYEDDPLDHDCLVESPDGKDLFLVSRRRFCIKVFKLSQRGNWTRVRSIGDMAIFVGINQSVSLPASHFPDILKPNSIYFTGRHYNGGDLMKPYAGVFSLEDKSIQFFKLTNGQKLCHWRGIPPPVWFIPSTTS